MNQKSLKSRPKPLIDKYKGVSESKEYIVMILRDKQGNETRRKL